MDAHGGQTSTGNGNTGMNDLETGGGHQSQAGNHSSNARSHVSETMNGLVTTAGTALREEFWESDLHKAVRQRANGATISIPTNPSLAGTADSNGMPPLYLAIHLGDIKTAKELIETFRTDLSFDGPKGQNVLHVAALRSKELTDEILKESPRDLRDKADDVSGSTPLHFAASVGVKGVTGLLLGHANDKGKGDTRTDAINKEDAMGMFPIHVAASVGAMDAIRALVKRNSSILCKSREGGTFLHVAVENKRTNVVKYVCTEPGFEVVLNMKNNDGNTALHLAVEKRDETIFSYLLGNRDVDLNHINKQGYTPLDLANKIKIQYLHASPKNPTEWMIRALAHSGAHFSARRRDLDWSARATQNNRGAVNPQNSEGDLARSSEATQNRRKHEEVLARSTESVLVASALIATLTFAAAVTVPGSYKTDKGTPALGSSYGFKVFLVADILAFYCSVAATFSLAEFGNRGNVDPLVRCTYAQRAVAFFHVALKSVIVAFAMGVSVVMWDISLMTTMIVTIATMALVLYGNEALAHDLKLMSVMYRRFGPSLSWNLYPATSSHLDWTSRRLQSFSATILWNTLKLFWTYVFIFLVAYLAQLRHKSVN